MTRTLYAGASILDGTGADPAVADLVVEDGRIVEVGTELDGDDRVELGGKSLLPGLFDCHTHVVVSSIDTMRLLQTPFSYRFFQAARNLEATVRTTSRSRIATFTRQSRNCEEGTRSPLHREATQTSARRW